MSKEGFFSYLSLLLFFSVFPSERVVSIVD